jgi:outer membrane protein
MKFRDEAASLYGSICLVLLGAMLMFSSPATSAENATGLSLGVGAGGAMTEYKDYDAVDIMPIPLLIYSGERFFLRGASGGVHLYKDRTHELSAMLSYLPQRFESDRSRDPAMRRLDDRYSTMLAGASYGLRTKYGTARVSASSDILGICNAVVADASYSYPFQSKNVWFVPAAGLTWTNGAYNDYYYGISAKESAKSGLPEYKAGDGVSPYVGVMTRIVVTDSLNVLVSGRAMFLSPEITGSPMVDRDVKLGFGAMLAYTF